MDKMRQSTAQVQGRCYLLELPNEMIEECLRFLPSKGDELAVALTCRRLQEVAYVNMYSFLDVDIKDAANVAYLPRAGRYELAARCVRDLSLNWPQDQPAPPSPWPFLGDVLEAFGRMDRLVEVTLPSWLLSATVQAIRASYSVEVITVDGPCLSLDSFKPDSALDPPHSIRFNLTVDLDDPSFVEEVLGRIRSAGDIVESLELQINPATFLPPFLLEPSLLPALKLLRLRLGSDVAAASLPWLGVASERLSSLSRVVWTIENDDPDHDFVLCPETWLTTGKGDNPAITSLFETWSGIRLVLLDVAQEVQTGTVSSIDLSLSDDQEMKPESIAALSRALGPLKHLTIGAAFICFNARWSDWHATLPAFGAFSCLREISFNTSVTPQTSADCIVGCSFECFQSATELVPSLRDDLALVGGDQALRAVEIRINLRRLELLAPYLPVGTDVEWESGERAAGSDAVRFSGSVEADAEGEHRLSLQPEGKGQDLDGQKCLVCDLAFAEDDSIGTPFDNLALCPVDEVRAALVLEGIDVNAIDARPLTGNETDFELFIRSGANAAPATTPAGSAHV